MKCGIHEKEEERMPYFGLLVFELIQQQALENFRPVAEKVKRVLASLAQCRIEVI